MLASAAFAMQSGETAYQRTDPIRWRSALTEAAEAGRSAGDLDKQRRTISSNASGMTPDCTRDEGAGGGVVK